MKLFASKSTRRDVVTLTVCAILIGAIFVPLQNVSAVTINLQNTTIQAGGNNIIDLKITAQNPSTVIFPGGIHSETIADGEIRVSVDHGAALATFHFNGTIITPDASRTITSLMFGGITHGASTSTTTFGNGYYYGYGLGINSGTPGNVLVGDGTAVTGISSTANGQDTTGSYTIHFDPTKLSTGTHTIRVDVLKTLSDANFFSTGDVSFTNIAASTTVSVPTGTGMVQITPTTDAGAIANFSAVSESTLAPAVQEEKPAGLSLPFGLFSFQVTGVPIGGTADVVLTFSQNLPAGTQYWKVIGGAWHDVTPLTTISGNKITLHLTDGAADDADHIANGVISDPGGPVLPQDGHSSESSTPSLSRPSFGGLDGEKFSDGLKINGKIFDISNYQNSIPQQSLPLDKTASISVKQQLQRGANTWQHVMIFMNLAGKDTKTGNADTWISIDKNEDATVSNPNVFITIHDPNGFITDASAVNDFIDEYTMVTTLHFVPVKQMSDSDIIIRSWDDQHRQSDVVVNGAISFGNADTSQPIHPAVIGYDATSTSNQSYLISDIKDWGGYSSNHISDSTLLYDMGIKGDHIPSWVAKLAKYVVNGDVSEKEFTNIIKYLSANGLIK